LKFFTEEACWKSK